MQFWLMTSEPDECSFDDVLRAPGKKTPWSGVRNYQARNFVKDQMKVGDGVLFYHSSCPEPGIAGLAEVASAAYVDKTQFDPKSDYYDPKSRPDSPRNRVRACDRRLRRGRAWPGSRPSRRRSARARLLAPAPRLP